MMWDAEIVKMRFVDAYDIERRMRVKGGPGGAGNSWPSYAYDEDDMKGWKESDQLDAVLRKKLVSSKEITRWSEAYFEWTPMIRIDRRVLVWRLAQCRATKTSFSEYCQRKGLVRATAYNRLERVFRDLAERFTNEGRLLLEPDEKWAGQETGGIGTDVGTMQIVATGPTTSKQRGWRSEPSTDLLNTPEDIEAFDRHRQEVNEQRRKSQLRRAKAMRGVPGEVAA
jgi:hypothetical protein